MARIGWITMEKFENRPKDSVGSSRIRGRWVWKYWDEAEEYQIGQKYDVLIFQKAYWKTMLESFEGIKIFDLCDPDWLEPRPVFEAISHCQAVVTSTEALAEYVRKLVKDKPVVCIPDRIDLEAYPEYKKKHEGRAKEVVWFGYAQNQTCLAKTLPFLKERDLRLTVISNLPYNPSKSPEVGEINNIKYNHERINEELMKRDIVLLPEVPGLRGKFKSNNKTLTAWALGLPAAKTPQDLDRFMDAEERTKEGLKRRKEVETKWDVRESVKEWKELLSKLK